jgi:hypothetical protein
MLEKVQWDRCPGQTRSCDSSGSQADAIMAVRGLLSEIQPLFVPASYNAEDGCETPLYSLAASSPPVAVPFLYIFSVKNNPWHSFFQFLF